MFDHAKGPSPKTSRLNQVPSVDLFGLSIAQIDLEGLLGCFRIALDGAKRSPTLIAYANAHGINLAFEDPAYRRAMQAVDLIYTDGNGLRLAAWLSGQRLPPRMTAADWYPGLFRMCQQAGHRVYLLGGQPGVARLAAGRLCKEFPGLHIVGTHHGYFPDAHAAQIIRKINQASPDLLVLGMGSPRQETWMVRHRAHLGAKVVWGAGGLLDYLSGTKRRAPRWMIRLGLEWLGRMLLEPRRLGPRYLIGLPKFLAHTLAFAARRRMRH